MKPCSTDIQSDKQRLEDVSFRLSALKFAAIILVLYNHSYTPVVHMGAADFHLEDFPVTMFVETFFSKNFVRDAVPLFFAVSGLIYFLKNYQESYGAFILKKVKGILWPYFLWNTVCIAYMFVLQTVSFTKKYFVSQDMIPKWGWYEWIHAYFGIEASWYPFLYPLWFLPILFLVFLIIPPLKKYFGKWPFLAIVLIVLHVGLSCFQWYMNSPVHHTVEGLSFFCFGYFIMQHLKTIDAKAVCILTGSCYVGLNLIRTFLALQLHKTFPLPVIFDSYLGVIFMFSLSRHLCSAGAGGKAFLGTVFSFSFVIYVMHENALAIIRKLAFLFLPAKPYMPLIIYFAIPVGLIAGLTFFGYVLKRRLPALYQFLFGR